MRHLRYGILLCAMIYTISCGDSFLKDAEILSELDGDTFYRTESDAVLAVTGAYTLLQSRALYKVELYALEYSTGDYAITEGGFQYANFPKFQFDNTEPQVITNIWKGCYLGIARANAVLEKVPAIEFANENLKNRILGEARFLRGLYYFFLVKIYGDVPIIHRLVGGPSDPLYLPTRNDAAEVYAFIEEDLKAAADVLPAKEEYNSEDVGRATKGAAQGYLGKVYLYQKKFTQARDVFKSIIDGQYGSFSLVDFEDNFTDTNENNAESVFEIQFTGGVGDVWAGDDTGVETESTYMGTLFGPQQFGNAYPSDGVNALFDEHPDDIIRRTYTVARPGDVWRSWDPVEISDWNARIPNAGGNSAIRKGNLGPDELLLQSSINYRLMRYADVLLMFAEAENEASNGPTIDAYAAINEVRRRAEVDPISEGLTKDQFFEIIRTERRLEFTFELSRYFDLIRWGLGAEMEGFKTGKNELIPIPASAIINNPNLLPNNPGW